MILQYKGFNNNWTYEEADIITWAMVYIGRETQKYRKDGVRYKYYIERREAAHEDDKWEIDLDYNSEIYRAVEKIIQKETKCYENIIYSLNDMKIRNIDNICIVTLQGRGSNKTYAFFNGVYLLNDRGGTVQKIA